jgi:ATP-dependent protease ClpP protease subunit
MGKINAWLSVKNEAGDPERPAELMVYGTIGKSYFDDEKGVEATAFQDALKSIPANRKIECHIHSPGGNVWEAFAIHGMIRSRGNVTTICDGIAASAASVIFQAGSTRVMPKLSMQMAHNPTALCQGNAEDMRAAAEKLEAHADVLAQMYADRTGLSVKECRAIMDKETWMSGEECLERGFCDSVTDSDPVKNSFDFSQFRCVPDALRLNQETKCAANVSATKKEGMSKEKILALLKEHGQEVAADASDEVILNALQAAVKNRASGTPNSDPGEVAKLTRTVENITAQLEKERKTRITATVNAMVGECRLTAAEAPKAIARAIADESYMDELRARPQALPGAAPLDASVSVVADDVQNVFKSIRSHLGSGPGAVTNAAERSVAIGTIFRKERERILPVLNAATNTVDSALKRVLILNETVRAFARRMLPIRAFATSFQNVPLQGTDEVVIPYYALQIAASSNFVEATGYVFDQATATSMKKITVNKRKYQPLDYSSQEFRRQPYLDTVRLGNLNAEKLAADVFDDIWSVVTLAAYGAAVKTAAAAAMTSDDVVDIAGACTKANWPTGGRSLILDSDTVTALMKDSAYKLASSIGGTEVVREGRLPRLSGFDVYEVPNLPSNSEKLQGAAVFMSAVLAAFAPVEPADGVRASLVAYEVATDAETGISMNYRKWGDAKLDRNFEVIECAYGYVAGVAAALKRICTP